MRDIAMYELAILFYSIGCRAIVGAGVGQFKSKTLGIHPNVFTRFHNAADR